MKARSVCTGSSLMGFAVGLAAGLTAGLLAAPMRGTDLRANIRSRAQDGSARLQSYAESGRQWAQHTMDRAVSLAEEGRRAFTRRTDAEPASLTAPLGEIAQMHPGRGFTEEPL